MFRFHAVSNLWWSEFTGFLNDLLLYFPLMAGGCLVFWLLAKWSVRLAQVTLFAGIFLSFLLALLILQYFIYQLQPLDVFLFEHTRQEVLFTIQTTEVNYVQLFLFALASGFLALALYRLKQSRWTQLLFYTWILLTCLAIPARWRMIAKPETVNALLVLNKPLHFYDALMGYLFKKEHQQHNNANNITANYRKAFPGPKYLDAAYPYLHEANKADVLGPFFNKSEKPPHIVVLMVEGLANDFLHPYHGLQLMPFLDSLSQHALYWDRFLTLGERSYAVTPGLTASLPYAESGFTMQDNQPYHFSLVNVLKRNGYFTSFYYGQGAWFHNKNVYYQNNFIDRITDKEKFAATYPRIVVKEEKNFFWGYDDQSLFAQAAAITDTMQADKRLDIFFTGSMHNPFTIQRDADYQAWLNEARKQNPGEETFYSRYGKFLKATRFANDALRQYFTWYKTRPDFANTIFIITGDHPMTDIPIQNSLKRYHVPLIVYSPLLKGGHTFHAVGSHLDVFEPLLAFLHQQYKLEVPHVHATLSSVLDTSLNFVNRKPVVFMNGNRDIIDIYAGRYYLTETEKLYEVDADFNLKAIENKQVLAELKQQLQSFEQASDYSCKADRLLPDSLFFAFNQIKPYHYLRAPLKVSFKDEFYEVVGKTPIPNTATWFNLSGTFDNKSTASLTGVYQLTNARDSLILWTPFGIDAGKTAFKFHVKINKQAVADSVLYFKAYFTNPQKQPWQFQTKAAVYTYPR